MYSGHARLSVCLSVHSRMPTLLHGMVGVPSSCALLDGFAIGARVTLLWQYSAARIGNRCTWQHSGEHEMSASTCLYSLYAWFRFLSTNISQGSAATRLRCGGILIIHLEIYCEVCRWKNFENWLAFGKVTGKSRVALFPVSRHCVFYNNSRHNI